MKMLRLFPSVAVFTLAAAAIAQSGAPTQPDTHKPSEAQAPFDQLKALAGSWEGSLDGKPSNVHVTLRVTSMGNTLMHEIKVPDQPDNPITMFHLDGEKLVLTHYCDAGNQPHMVATVSPDGKTITFDFVSATNLLPTQMGHMQHVVFTLIDADHHTESWNFAMADGKKMGGVLDLHRAR